MDHGNDARSWPTAAINVSEFHAQTMVAFRSEPEPASRDGALAAVDPDCVKTQNQKFQVVN
jgi:hypothetical protein